MTYDTDENSVELSAPREGFEIILPAVTYRLTSGNRNIVISGHMYTASPIKRGELAISSTGNARELIFTLPVSHALAQRYMKDATPPKSVYLNVYRHQVESNATETIWRGYVTSMAPDRHLANFRCPARSGEVMPKRLPTITAGRQCAHILYDAACQVSRPAFSIEAIVTNVNGRVVTVNALGGQPDQWAQYGEVEHMSSGERMTVLDHTGLVLTMQAPIYEIATGDHVIVFPGCDHSVTTCWFKFANQLNFGGFPLLPNKNPHMPSGLGVIEQA